MHSFFEGVVKNILKYWLNPEYSKYNFSVRKYINSINSRLVAIKPPQFVPIKPRPIFTHNEWRANEYLSFLIYFSLPVMRNILQIDQYENLKKLVLFAEVLLSPSIKRTDLNQAQKLIVQFVKEFQKIYNSTLMLSGIHEMLHLVDCCLDFGPLNHINSFQYEELNRKVKNLICGRDLMGEEFIKIFTAAQLIQNYSNSSILSDFIKHNNVFYTKNFKNIARTTNVRFTDKITKTSDQSLLSEYCKIFNEKLSEIEIYKKINQNGIIFSSICNEYTRCDSCFIDKKKESA